MVRKYHECDRKYNHICICHKKIRKSILKSERTYILCTYFPIMCRKISASPKTSHYCASMQALYFDACSTHSLNDSMEKRQLFLCFRTNAA